MRQVVQPALLLPLLVFGFQNFHQSSGTKQRQPLLADNLLAVSKHRPFDVVVFAPVPQSRRIERRYRAPTKRVRSGPIHFHASAQRVPPLQCQVAADVTNDIRFLLFSDETFQFIFREWFTNPSYAWPFIIAMGCIGAFAFYFVFNAYSIASPSVVSLYEYSLIIWSIITGYLIFDNIPTVRTFIGVSIIIGAGVYIYFREKVKDQLIVTDTPNR